MSTYLTLKKHINNMIFKLGYELNEGVYHVIEGLPTPLSIISVDTINLIGKKY